MTTPKKIIAILGVTASGKTVLAQKLAEHLGGIVVACDSRLVYRGLDFGTAKPPLEERGAIPHLMMDLVDPGEPFNVGRYHRSFATLLHSLAADPRPLIICGGTGLYFESLIRGILPARCDNPVLAEALEKRWNSGEEANLFRELGEMDPRLQGLCHPTQKRRILRYLEILQASGSAYSDLQREQNDSILIKNYFLFKIIPDNRVDLHRAIEIRTQKMVGAGLVEETEKLVNSFNCRDFLRGVIGYREVLEWSPTGQPPEALISAIAKNTRDYAKRQATWFRKYPAGGLLLTGLDPLAHFNTVIKALAPPPASA